MEYSSYLLTVCRAYILLFIYSAIPAMGRHNANGIVYKLWYLANRPKGCPPSPVKSPMKPPSTPKSAAARGVRTPSSSYLNPDE